MDLLRRLQEWYKMHCDGDWEHSYGVKIDTLDNPGWKLKVDLTGTLLENVDFLSIKAGDPENKTEFWLECAKKKGKFVACGSVDALEKMIFLFLEWAERNTDTSPWDSTVDEMIAQCHELNDVEQLRDLFRKINDIPNEHPHKAVLIEAFNEKWNELLENNMIQ